MIKPKLKVKLSHLLKSFCVAICDLVVERKIWLYKRAGYIACPQNVFLGCTRWSSMPVPTPNK